MVNSWLEGMRIWCRKVYHCRLYPVFYRISHPLTAPPHITPISTVPNRWAKQNHYTIPSASRRLVPGSILSKELVRGLISRVQAPLQWLAMTCGYVMTKSCKQSTSSNIVRIDLNPPKFVPFTDGGDPLIQWDLFMKESFIWNNTVRGLLVRLQDSGGNVQFLSQSRIEITNLDHPYVLSNIKTAGISVTVIHPHSIDDQVTPSSSSNDSSLSLVFPHLRGYELEAFSDISQASLI